MKINNPQGGAFLVSRQLFESEIWLTKPTSWNKIWIYILGRVNHSDNGAFKRGQGFFNFTPSHDLAYLGKEITSDKIKKCFSFLKKSGQIDTKRSTRGVLVTVLNYDKFQTLDNYSSTDQSTKKALRKHQESTPINKYDKNEKNEKNNTMLLENFENFWKAYPRNPHKVAKPQAFKSWSKLSPTGDLLLGIMSGLEKWKLTNSWVNGEFIPNPSKWLNERRWEDTDSLILTKRVQTREEMLDVARKFRERYSDKGKPSGNLPDDGGNHQKHDGGVARSSEVSGIKNDKVGSEIF